ncbi:MAG: hypothetical protein ACNS60_03705 [Candidatus Cyclobacteriaceae bacterium M2_1C_046]
MKIHGKFITQSKAQKQIRDYISQVLPKRQIQEQDAVIGNLFSLNEVEALMSYIKDHNVKTTEEQQKIGGLRVYNAWNENSPHKDKSTVLLIPVKNNGMDVKNVYTPPTNVVNETAESTENDTSTLGEPDPCPNSCS